MAKESLAHPANVPGDFFVDTTCIDCPTCRQIAPHTFGDDPWQAIVVKQPVTPEDQKRALMALVCCPEGSIGVRRKIDFAPVFEALPEPLAEEVYACGYASRESYGAQSYLIRHPEGNILVDCPRFVEQLAKKFEAMGGIRFMVFSHEDDVGQHERFRRRFGCERVIHEGDAKGPLGNVEKVLRGEGPWMLCRDVKVIHTPGHTRGHIVVLYRNEFLFTGDHLYWYPYVGGLTTSRRYNRYAWEAQIQSVEKLLQESFTWILPGHGYRYHAPREVIQEEIRKALARMRA